MKIARYTITFVFCIIMCLLVMLTSCSREKRRIDEIKLPIETEQLLYDSSVMFQSETGIEGIAYDSFRIYVNEYGKKTLLNMGDTEENREVAIGCTIQAGSDRYFIEDGIAYCNEKEMQFPDGKGFYYPIGFWILEEQSYIAAIKIVYDSVDIDIPVSQEFMLFPLGRML